jgi:hypothetical protein
VGQAEHRWTHLCMGQNHRQSRRLRHISMSLCRYCWAQPPTSSDCLPISYCWQFALDLIFGFQVLLGLDASGLLLLPELLLTPFCNVATISPHHCLLPLGPWLREPTAKSKASPPSLAFLEWKV